ncbi:MAG: hypothetical protein J6X62_06470 [Bacteroidales bacterium]|nr:hypothetical protein [Bacteroidales bacterium]
MATKDVSTKGNPTEEQGGGKPRATEAERRAIREELEALAHATKFGADMGDDNGEGRRTLGQRIRGLVNHGQPITSKTLMNWLPCIIFIAILCLLLVWHRYYVEQLSKERKAATERINMLKERQTDIQKESQQSVKISKILEEMDTLGQPMQVAPPYILGKSNK